MHIRFEKVKLNNFMSFENAEIDFNDYKGYCIIKGVNNNLVDNAISNGAGKSTIFEAINWCLTGTTLRGNKDVVRIGSTDCNVEVTFIIDNDRYVITRYKGTTSNLIVYINDENKSGKGIRDTEKLFAEYLPDLTSSLINTVIILGQGLPMRFTNNTPAGRKEILEKLSKSDYMIEDLKARVDARCAELNKKLRELEDTLVAKSSAKSVHINTINSSTEKLNNLRDISDIESDLREARLNQQTSQALLDAEQEKYNSIQQSISEANENILNLNTTYISTRDAYKLTFTEANITPISNDITELKTTAEALRREIVRLESVKDTCPTCGQKLPDVVKIDTTSKRTELTNLEDKIKELNDSKRVQEDLLKAELDRMYNKFQETCKPFSDLISTSKNELANVLSDINIHKQDVKSQDIVIRSLETVVSTYENDKKNLQLAIENSTVEIEKIENDILYINNATEDVKRHLEIVNKFVSILKRDFRGYLLKNIIDYIDAKSKEYCEYIFGTQELDFLLDGNNICIRYSDKEYEALSGGEKQKVDLIVQFALRDMLSKYLNFSSNILVLDEITDNLDSKGCEKIIDFISNKLDDVQDIFIISHRADSLNIPYDTELIIEKNNDGVSKIV